MIVAHYGPDKRRQRVNRTKQEPRTQQAVAGNERLADGIQTHRMPCRDDDAVQRGSTKTEAPEKAGQYRQHTVCF